MKKIDLHIHTISTDWDSDFNFDIANLEKYISKAKLDAIAITNHNMFDGEQFNMISKALGVVVFPGIEISLDCGHILIISDSTDLEDFEGKAKLVAQKITQIENRITVDELETIFNDLNDYLVIPHYQKGPAIQGEALKWIASYVSVGEVDSPKKFIRAIKDKTMLTPVLFSDERISDELDSLPTRQTFIDCGELTLNAIKTCLKDKGKVALSETKGNNLFQVFDDGQMLSTGLNVLLGERSSGKTWTLNKINKLNNNVKYIEQFSLVQKDDAKDKRDFKKHLQNNQSQILEDYLSEFKVVLNDVMSVDLQANERSIEKYVDTLLRAAEDADRRDVYSKTALFDESLFSISEDKTLRDLIESVQQVIENVEFRGIIEKHIDLNSMKRLICELIELLRSKKLETKKKELVNSLIRDIKESLQLRSASEPIEDIDLYRVSIEKRKVDRFSEIVKFLQKEATIWKESIQAFSVVVEKGAFAGAGEIKEANSGKGAFREQFKQYGKPYLYLQTLLADENLMRSELYKLFAKISYRILNRDGVEVSGGERSEFRLLRKIKDSQNHDFLLIDEPESSFDNLFLNSDVNNIIKDISKSMPVVVVTHNNTVGASVGADYLLYAKKEIKEGGPVYKLYSGHPTDQELKSLDGTTINNHEVMLDSLEAGHDAYIKRRQGYEAIKN
ncbi:phosphate transporter ATP-binding protein [Limihaloglobus sulfuriphilus]|uniref:Phosphate transporter ATP-binding protein n=1 Tax=Limihaloglobus sulfuriphilus TaxID=1851148 RepID=A0A1Q2MB95_9BACT|nr:PHP domain-containing protein [Limihaloglobus sulfuriphilus]AQQ69930.1 phosphate transporter ATP-binding protein [Limihaloglobus sulfuriphilus]